ncbi:MAG: transcriptional regulator [Gammaproteobacteria bacterium]|nr:transcriptional regulator [Gammaproteobacteria bacterium]
MNALQSPENLENLVRELCKLPRETEWVEFKVNEDRFHQIGEYISALANSAALLGKDYSYLIWGVSDKDHAVVGTNFDPDSARVGNEELENWLLRLLDPRINFRFLQASFKGVSVVVLEIPRALRQPVRFEGQEYVRVGSYKKKLKGFPEKERALWRIFEQTPFENRIALEQASDEEVIRLLDYPSYFELLDRPLPENRHGILNALADEGLIRRDNAGGWNVTNLGLVLFARNIEDLGGLHRKALRIIQYDQDSRIVTLKERMETKGYASGFEGLIRSINDLLPSNEVIGEAIRKTVPMFPEPALREIVANALIHQDFFITGTGPMVEIFSDRIEVTSPGAPLVDIYRLIDSPPRSRNESLASLMRRIGICEERGSGWDKIIFQSELYQLPAPLVEVVENNTRVVMFASRPLLTMHRTERVRATYFHACLQYVNRKYVTNSSVRGRFGIAAHNRSQASRLISEAIDEGVIVPHNPDAPPKMKRYSPWWAKG